MIIRKYVEVMSSMKRFNANMQKMEENEYAGILHLIVFTYL